MVATASVVRSGKVKAARKANVPSAGLVGRNGSENRRGEMLDAAARAFSQWGYDGTSIRDIAGDVGVQPSSLYYFFKSKEDLFEAVYEKGVEEITTAVETAIKKSGDPWTRMELAASGHLEALLSSDDYNTLVANIVPRGSDEFNKRLVRYRDAYEKIFIKLVQDLPLPPRTERRILRLTVLGALNGVVNWYRPGGTKPATIAKKIVRLFRAPLDATTGTLT